MDFDFARARTQALFALHSLPSLPHDITAAFDAHECYDAAEETVPFIAPEWIERPRCAASAGSDAEDDDCVVAAGAMFLEHDMDWVSAPESPVRFLREPEHVERARRARELARDASEIAERARREATIKSALFASARPAVANPNPHASSRRTAMSAFTHESAHDSFVTAADGRVFKIASDLIESEDEDDARRRFAASRLEDSAAAHSSDGDAEDSDGDHIAVCSVRRKRGKTPRGGGVVVDQRRGARKPAGATKAKARATDVYVSVDGKRQRRGCLHCGTVKTPQWRMGPEGKKTLCNACGVRHMKGIL